MPVLSQEGLRPSGDRTRETLFNWLQFELAGRRCLDLCAGTGALGVEALSRGAAHCDFIEPNRQTAAHLRASLQTLQSNRAQVHQLSAQTFLASELEPYDLIFIDPPFDSHLWPELSNALMAKPHLNPGALVYLELPKAEPFHAPPSWTQRKNKTLGQVSMRLYEYATSG